MKRTQFCGSSAGIDSTFMSQPFSDKHWQSIKLNLFMAALMLWGAVADGVLNGGGTVGVIPDFLRSKKSLTMD
jgi:hypothetical protein